MLLRLLSLSGPLYFVTRHTPIPTYHYGLRCYSHGQLAGDGGRYDISIPIIIKSGERRKECFQATHTNAPACVIMF